MHEESSPPNRVDPRLKMALSHARRLEVLGYLMKKRDRKGTDRRELARALGLTAAEVDYHLGVLRDADLIVRVEGERGDAKGGRSYVVAGRR